MKRVRRRVDLSKFVNLQERRPPNTADNLAGTVPAGELLIRQSSVPQDLRLNLRYPGGNLPSHSAARKGQIPAFISLSKKDLQERTESVENRKLIGRVQRMELCLPKTLRALERIFQRRSFSILRIATRRAAPPVLFQALTRSLLRIRTDWYRVFIATLHSERRHRIALEFSRSRLLPSTFRQWRRFTQLCVFGKELTALRCKVQKAGFEQLRRNARLRQLNEHASNLVHALNKHLGTLYRTSWRRLQDWTKKSKASARLCTVFMGAAQRVAVRAWQSLLRTESASYACTFSETASSLGAGSKETALAVLRCLTEELCEAGQGDDRPRSAWECLCDLLASKPALRSLVAMKRANVFTCQMCEQRRVLPLRSMHVEMTAVPASVQIHDTQLYSSQDFFCQSLVSWRDETAYLATLHQCFGDIASVQPLQSCSCPSVQEALQYSLRIMRDFHGLPCSQCQQTSYFLQTIFRSLPRYLLVYIPSDMGTFVVSQSLRLPSDEGEVQFSLEHVVTKSWDNGALLSAAYAKTKRQWMCSVSQEHAVSLEEVFLNPHFLIYARR